MRKVLRKVISKSKVIKQQDIVLASIDATKRENDRLVEENLELHTSIKLKRRSILKLQRDEEDLIKHKSEIEGNIEEKKEEEQLKRQQLLKTQSELSGNECLLKDEITHNTEKIDSLEGDLKIKQGKYETEIQLIQKRLDEKICEDEKLKEGIIVLQNQKSELYNSAEKEVKKLDNIKLSIVNKKKELQQTVEMNDKIQKDNIQLVVESEGLKEEHKVLLNKQKLETEVLDNINNEVRKQDKALDVIKETHLSLIGREEKFRTKEVNLIELYRKAGLKYKL